MTDLVVKNEVSGRETSQNIPKPNKRFTASLIRATVADIEALSPEWEALTRNEPYREPFFQPYWFKAFATTFYGGKPVQLLVVRDESRLRGVLPLMRQRHFFFGIPAKTLCSLSGIHSCRYDFVCPPEEREAIALAAWNCLKRSSNWNVIEAINVPEGGAFDAIMRHAQKDGCRVGRWPTLMSPYLPLPAKDSDPLSNCPAKYKSSRKRLERYYRRLKERGEPRLEVITEFSEEVFNEFVRMEGAGWKRRTGGAISCNSTIVDFYREVLKHASDRRQLRMCALVVGEKRVAMEMAFVLANRCFSPKIAYDEEFSKCAPGQLLARYAIEDLVSKGIERYDLLGSRARHKVMWAGEVRQHAHCYIFRPSLFGALYHRIVTMIAPRVKRIKHSLYGDPQALVGCDDPPLNSQ